MYHEAVKKVLLLLWWVLHTLFILHYFFLYIMSFIYLHTWSMLHQIFYQCANYPPLRTLFLSKLLANNACVNATLNLQIDSNQISVKPTSSWQISSHLNLPFRIDQPNRKIIYPYLLFPYKQ